MERKRTNPHWGSDIEEEVDRLTENVRFGNILSQREEDVANTFGMSPSNVVFGGTTEKPIFKAQVMNGTMAGFTILDYGHYAKDEMMSICISRMLDFVEREKLRNLKKYILKTEFISFIDDGEGNVIKLCIVDVSDY